MTSHIWCPACGWFGLKARRRARRNADANLIRFHAQLARETRRERVMAIIGPRVPPWQRELVMAWAQRRQAELEEPIAVTNCRVMGVGPAQAIPRDAARPALVEIRQQLRWYLSGEQGTEPW